MVNTNTQNKQYVTIVSECIKIMYIYYLLKMTNPCNAL